MLTTADVEQKTFSTALRGYDLDEVDDFLDEIVATIRELSEQLEAAQQRTGETSAPVAVTGTEPGPVPTEIDESAVGRALVAAQTAADRLLEDARVEAAKIVEGAQGEADTWESEREAKRVEAQNEIVALAARVDAIRSELAVLAGEVSGKLDEMEAVIEGSDLDQPVLQPVADSIDEVSSDGEEETTSEPVHSSYEPDSSAESHESVGAHEDSDSDELDDMLNGVASDLRLGNGEDETSEEHLPEGDTSA